MHMNMMIRIAFDSFDILKLLFWLNEGEKKNIQQNARLFHKTLPKDGSSIVFVFFSISMFWENSIWNLITISPAFFFSFFCKELIVCFSKGCRNHLIWTLYIAFKTMIPLFHSFVFVERMKRERKKNSSLFYWIYEEFNQFFICNSTIRKALEATKVRRLYLQIAFIHVRCAFFFFSFLPFVLVLTHLHAHFFQSFGILDESVFFLFYYFKHSCWFE